MPDNKCPCDYCSNKHRSRNCTEYLKHLHEQCIKWGPLVTKCWQDAHRLEFTPVMLQLAKRARLRDLFCVTLPADMDWDQHEIDHDKTLFIVQFFPNETLDKASGLDEAPVRQHVSFGHFSVGDAALYFLSLLQSDGSSGDLEGSSSSRDAARHFLSLLEFDGSSGDLEGSSSRDSARHFLSLLESDGSSGDLEGSSSSSGVDPDQGSSSDESESDDEGRRALRHKPF